MRGMSGNKEHHIALFGEAEKGEFETAYVCSSLAELSYHLGEPPSLECRGLPLAVQSLLFERRVIYFRVKEEGFSKRDYVTGLQFLQNRDLFPEISAICLPGVGDHEILDATNPLLDTHRSLLILSESDLYDYLTA